MTLWKLRRESEEIACRVRLAPYGIEVDMLSDGAVVLTRASSPPMTKRSTGRTTDAAAASRKAGAPPRSIPIPTSLASPDLSLIPFCLFFCLSAFCPSPLLPLPPGTRRIRRYPHEQFPEVPAVEQPQKRLRRPLQSLDDILAILQPPLSEPGAAVAEEVASRSACSPTMNPRMVTRPTSSARSPGPCVGIGSLYSAITPQSGMRACGFSSGNTASNTLPPTFSK